MKRTDLPGYFSEAENGSLDPGGILKNEVRVTDGPLDWQAEPAGSRLVKRWMILAVSGFFSIPQAGAAFSGPVAGGPSVAGPISGPVLHQAVISSSSAAGEEAPRGVSKSLPDFSYGIIVPSADIQGDGFGRTGLKMRAGFNKGASLAKPLKRKAPTRDGSYTLNSRQISGDGFIIGAGERQLVDAAGLMWLVNTNVTSTTFSSASGAIAVATFTRVVNATTASGGTVATVLSGAFDGYGGLIVNGVVYNNNGVALTECQGPVSGINRQVVYPKKTIGNFEVYRKVFIPDNDAFARHLEIVKNIGTASETVTLKTSNNLGSDGDTFIFATSDGDLIPELTDHWVGTMENYTAGISPDPRLAHVFSGPGGKIGISALSFINGNDEPFWEYSFGLDPGQTAMVMHFVTGQATKAAAAAQADYLMNLPQKALQCLTVEEKSQIVNFGFHLFLPIILKQ